MNITKQIGLCGILLSGIGLTAPASAAITTFQQGVNGYTGATSTYTEYQPGAAQPLTYGGRDIALLYNGGGVESKVMFMRFDVSSLSAGVDVNAASLSLYVEGNGGRGEGYGLTYSVYPILREGLNFGTVNGDVEDGALSFNYSSYSPTTPVGWGAANTVTWGPQSGVDYGTTEIGSFTLTSVNADSAYVNFALDSQTVAGWINNPSSNLGFVIVAGVGGNQAVLQTGNSSNAALRPAFTVDVVAVPEPSALALSGLAAVVGVIAVARRRKSGLAVA